MNSKAGTRNSDRRGIAVIVVLLLLSLTLTLSYAAMRSQSVAARIQRNAGRRPSAQQAAMTGMAIALKKMSKSDWAGVNTTLSGSLGLYDSYQVTYTTGDPSLTSSSSDYSDYPYRVTLLATGSSVDPGNSHNVATYQIRAVVRLVPRALAAEPSQWSTMTQYTVCQTQFGDFDIVVPSRIEGPVFTQAWIGVSHDIWPVNGSDYWNITAAGLQYYGDLNLLRTAKGLDWRPLNAQLSLLYLFIQPGNVSTVLNGLGISMTQSWFSNTYSWNPPGSMSTYRIYPGGKQYQVQALDSSVQNATIQPNMTTNPLGIYFRSGPIDLYDNAKFQGTLVTSYTNSANVTVRGRGVSFTPVNLPALYGTTVPIQLPAVASGGSLVINSNADVTINGQVAVANAFNILSSGQTGTTMSFLGQLIASSVTIEARSEWLAQSSGWWTGRLNAFAAQKNQTGGYKHFPQYLQKNTSLDPTPRLIIKPSATSVRYHWQSWTGTQNADNPIFVPASGDGGLRWDLLGWAENPS